MKRVDIFKDKDYDEQEDMFDAITVEKKREYRRPRNMFLSDRFAYIDHEDEITPDFDSHW